MALSLLYHLLEIKTMQQFDELQKYPPQTDDGKRALKYRNMNSNQPTTAQRKDRRAVRKALYEALYVIAEGADVNPELSTAMGRALCNGIEAVLKEHPDDREINSLRTALQQVVRDALDEVEG